MLLSGPEHPTMLNFLPEDHIVVPRTVNLICGPSKTGDVELEILEGAHGPRRLHVVVVWE